MFLATNLWNWIVCMSAFLGIVFHESSSSKKNLKPCAHLIDTGLAMSCLPLQPVEVLHLAPSSSLNGDTAAARLGSIDFGEKHKLKKNNSCIVHRNIQLYAIHFRISSNSWGTAPCIWLDYTFCSHSRAGYTAQLPSPQSLLCTLIKFSWRVFDNLYSILKLLRK